MLQTEFIRNLHSNYERILLEEKPEERKYQYCILSRGGIKGLLSCSLRYINAQAYLYYDITSRQNVAQLYSGRLITRQWIKDFLWSFRKLTQELDRFLLDSANVLWRPDQIFQELESNIFSFIYVPYYEGQSEFHQLLEFWVDHIDYEDESLVECVYKMYEQYERNGDAYLQEQIYTDAQILEQELPAEMTTEEKQIAAAVAQDEAVDAETSRQSAETIHGYENAAEENEETSRELRKGIFARFEGRKKKNKEARSDYRQAQQMAMAGMAVAEDTPYEMEEYGQTIYIEETPEQTPAVHRIYTPEGRLLAQLDKPILAIGKKKGEVDLVLEDTSVSRMHARLLTEKDAVYLEDLNSTNGTFKNGLRMQPCEKRRLEPEDEIKIGRTVLIFR